MVSVKGPRSALTDFIEQHGIKIEKSTPNKENKKPTQVKRKVVTKKAKKNKPFELSIIHDKSLQNILLSKIITNINNFEVNDDHLETISSYLSNQRMFNLEYFNTLVKLCKEKLVIYDCSMIKEDDFLIDKSLKHIELHQCGQLTNYKLNEILNGQKNLEVLRITGAYLLTEVVLPKKLKVLDFGNCNRMSPNLILEINKKYKKLDELRLSYCYKITDEIKLKTLVSKLYLEETRVSEAFFNPKNLTHVSFKNCININKMNKKYEKLISLDLENITTIENINVRNLTHLNIQRCHNFTISCVDLTKLEFLNMSYLEIESFDFLLDMKNLKEVDLSWCPNVTDELIQKLVENTCIEKISVFGCFNLTSKTAKMSYEYKNKVVIVGNHAETKFLIQNN